VEKGRVERGEFARKAKKVGLLGKVLKGNRPARVVGKQSVQRGKRLCPSRLKKKTLRKGPCAGRKNPDNVAPWEAVKSSNFNQEASGKER